MYDKINAIKQFFISLKIICEATNIWTTSRSEWPPPAARENVTLGKSYGAELISGQPQRERAPADEEGLSGVPK